MKKVLKWLFVASVVLFMAVLLVFGSNPNTMDSNVGFVDGRLVPITTADEIHRPVIEPVTIPMFPLWRGWWPLIWVWLVDAGPIA